MTYIALLRAINVGGHTVKMDALRALFEEMGFTNVRTYIQTGNVFFDTDKTDQAQLTSDIEAHLEKSLGYAVPTMLRTVEELEAVVASQPFKGIELKDDMRFLILFLKDPLPAGLTFPIWSAKEDMQLVNATDTEAFVVMYIKQPGKVPNASGELEKILRGKTTSRFFHTTEKILAAAKS